MYVNQLIQFSTSLDGVHISSYVTWTKRSRYLTFIVVVLWHKNVETIIAANIFK